MVLDNLSLTARTKCSTRLLKTFFQNDARRLSSVLLRGEIRILRREKRCANSELQGFLGSNLSFMSKPRDLFQKRLQKHKI